MTGSRLATLRSLRASRRARRSAALCAVIALFTVLAMLGDLLSPTLRERYPLVLMLLTPRTAYLAAASDQVPFVLFLSAAVFRLCAADPVHFMLGRTTGPAGVAAASRIRLVGSLVRRAPSSCSNRLWLAGVVASPTAKTMLVTGAAGVRARWVAVADVAGTVVRVLVIWRAGQAFPMLAQKCATLVPLVVVPSCLAGAAIGTVRWHRQRTDRTVARVDRDDEVPATPSPESHGELDEGSNLPPGDVTDGAVRGQVAVVGSA
jgi:hypothetical protein